MMKTKIADPEGQNEDRAEKGMQAVETFMTATGLTKADGLDTAILDLVADLGHLCDRKDLNMEELLLRAKNHYDAETIPDSEGEIRGGQFDFLNEEAELNLTPDPPALDKYHCPECGSSKNTKWIGGVFVEDGPYVESSYANEHNASRFECPCGCTFAILAPPLHCHCGQIIGGELGQDCDVDPDDNSKYVCAKHMPPKTIKTIETP